MSTKIQAVAEHAKAQLAVANDTKTEVLNKAVDSLKKDVAQRDKDHDSTMAANTVLITELEAGMQQRYNEYSAMTTKMIAELTENDEEGIDSVSEVVAALIKADEALDNSMLAWGVAAEARKAAMIAQIGDTVDVSA
jgi:hypothetical protein